MSEVQVRDDGEEPEKPTAVIVVPEDASPDERLNAAYKMRRNGLPWREVAKHAGFANSDVARVDVRRWLQTTAARIDEDARMEALELDLDRIDDVIATYKPYSDVGSFKAAELVLKAVAQRSKLLDYEGLHATDKAAGTRTIIIPMGEGDYAEALKEIVQAPKAIQNGHS